MGTRKEAGRGQDGEGGHEGNARKLGNRVKWVKDLRMALEAFGWQRLNNALSGLSMNEVKHILKCMAWRTARRGGGKKLKWCSK